MIDQDQYTRHLAAIVESSDDAIISKTLDGKVTSWNKSAERIFGYSSDEMIGKHISILIPSDLQKEEEMIISKIRNDEPIDHYQTTRVNKKGERIQVSLSVSPIRNNSGKIVGASKIIRDISYQKRAEQFIELLDAAPDAMVIVNSEGKIVLVNIQTETIFGYKRDELLGQRVEMLIPLRYREHHSQLREDFFISPKTRNMGAGLELSGKKKDGSEFPIEISLSPLKTPEGVLVSAAIRDVTEKKRLEGLIREANANLEIKVQQRTAELERKNKELEQFAYVASHDLQEPLRTTTGFVEIFKRKYYGNLDEEANKILDYMAQASDRMKVLINDLLDYSRIGRKKELKQVDCNVLLQEVIADLDSSIKASAARVRVQPLPVINAYPTELKLVFQNLISNSIKFRRKDEIPVVVITAEKEKGQWRFCVEDNGIGIDEKHKDRIFVIFQRLHTRNEYEGSGIGLAHCKKIVELHGGTIWVESVFGKGTKIFFTIQEM